jgi:hypothetical protein
MPKSSVYGPDTSFLDGLNSLAEMFNPKVAADAQLKQAHAGYYGSASESALAEARKRRAEAAGLEDRNSALADTVLANAGFTPQQRATIRFTRPDSVADVFKGVNLSNGADMLQNGGDPRVGLSLLGQGNAATDQNFAFSDEAANRIAARNAALNLKANPSDLIKTATSNLELQDKLNNAIIASTGRLNSDGKSYEKQPSQDQVNSISNYAMKLINSGVSTSIKSLLSR